LFVLPEDHAAKDISVKPSSATSENTRRNGLDSVVAGANQEMVGLGAANLAAGFFQGFPISSSSSRTPVAEAAGARTQRTGVVGAIVVALLLLVAPNLLQNLPAAALAAVVIAAAIGLIEVTDLLRIFRIQQWEFWLSIVCFAGVAVFGAIPGIGLAIVIRCYRVPLGWLASALCGAGPGRRC
jgi:MFS superfamily sulfate permease-like transporter